MKLTVHGNNHFAWVSAAKLAEKGNQVTLCVRPHEGRVDAFDMAREPFLPALVAEQEAAGRLLITQDGGREARAYLLADDYSEASLRALLQSLPAGNRGAGIFLVLSPLPVGTLRRLQQEIDARREANGAPRRAFLASMPLFVREGTALADFERPQLFLLGSEDKEVIDCVQEFMRPFMRQAAEIMLVPVEAAELIKFGINAMLATRISFMNEMAALAEKVGVDIEIVRQGIGADPRIGHAYLQAGCGFGGPSLSSDLLSFSRTMKEELDAAGLMETVIAINESQKEILFRKIWRFFRGDLAGRTVAVWGAAFKPGTSSVSNSVVHPLLQALWAQGCRTRVYDPQAMEALRRVYRDQPLLECAASAQAATTGADAVALVTAWDEFWSPDFERVAQHMKTPVMFDGRNLYEPEQLQAYGFRYFGIGRGEQV
ncbi:MAG: UDP-glucose dehydrogenase family protein [Moraxellaceae bacterium]